MADEVEQMIGLKTLNVIPAKAGICVLSQVRTEMPAFAGMTTVYWIIQSLELAP